MRGGVELMEAEIVDTVEVLEGPISFALGEVVSGLRYYLESVAFAFARVVSKGAESTDADWFEVVSWWADFVEEAERTGLVSAEAAIGLEACFPTHVRPIFNAETQEVETVEVQGGAV